MLVASIGWSINGVGGWGECRIHRNGIEVADSTVAMGSTTAGTSGPGFYSNATITAVAGPFTGSGSYAVACRERFGDPDWHDITLSVLAIDA